MLDAMCLHGPALGGMRMPGHDARPRSFMESNCNLFSGKTVGDLQIAVGQTPSQSTSTWHGLVIQESVRKHGKTTQSQAARVLMRLGLSVKLCCTLLALKRRLVVSVTLEEVCQVLEGTRLVVVVVVEEEEEEES